MSDVVFVCVYVCQRMWNFCVCEKVKFPPLLTVTHEEFGPGVGWTSPPQWLDTGSPTIVAGPGRPNCFN